MTLMMRRAQAALNLSSPTSVCGSLNTAIRQGITLISTAFHDKNCEYTGLERHELTFIYVEAF